MKTCDVMRFISIFYRWLA